MATKRVMLDLSSTMLGDADRELLQSEAALGVILFARNIMDAAQVTQLCGEIKNLNPELLICVDQEGGRVQQLKTGYTTIPPMRAFGRLYDKAAPRALQLLHDTAWLLGQELKCSGIDFSFTPVLDLDYGSSTVIGDRAFHRDPDIVSRLAAALIDGLHEAGVACCGKHFPGHGFVAGDSHLELPRDERSLAEIEQGDLQAFIRLGSSLDTVMPAHVLYSRCDAAPAGYSAFWINYLRQRCGFTGLVFSDDLNMAGAALQGSMRERVDAALGAGCDVLLVCHDQASASEVLACVSGLSLPDLQGLETLYAQPEYSWAELRALNRYQATREALASLGQAE